MQAIDTSLAIVLGPGTDVGVADSVPLVVHGAGAEQRNDGGVGRPA